MFLEFLPPEVMGVAVGARGMRKGLGKKTKVMAPQQTTPSIYSGRVEQLASHPEVRVKDCKNKGKRKNTQHVLIMNFNC